MADPRSRSGFFKQSLPAVGLSLERLSERVPQDGYYYVLLAGEIKGRYRTKNGALSLYRSLLNSSGYKPQPIEKRLQPAPEPVERYMDELEAYWTESHKHARRGGKGRYK